MIKRPFRVLAILLIANLAGCTSKTECGKTALPTTYPAVWFAAVPTEGAPTWEILPQAAGPGEVILSKRNELGLLSNFAATPFTFRGKRYASLEGFWQAMKYPESVADPRAIDGALKWEFTREQVCNMTAFDAKHAGSAADANMKLLKITWVTFEGRRIEPQPSRLEQGASDEGEHYRLIRAATWAKVQQNAEVKRVLLATGHLVLKPDHHQGAAVPPAWRYYDIMKEIRTVLQKRNPPTAEDEKRFEYLTTK